MQHSRALAVLGLLAVGASACAHEREVIVEVREPSAPAIDVDAIVADVEARVAPRLAALVEAARNETAQSDATASLPAPPLPRPEAAYARQARWGKVPEGGGPTIAIPAKKGGYKFEELFAMVSRETGVTIRYEEYNAVIKSKTLTFVGDEDVPRGRLLSWLQAALSPHGLVLIPSGEQDAWFVLDQANANLFSTPVVLDEDQLPGFARRDGMYVYCVLTLPHGLDSARTRQALSQLSTKTAGLGRINDIPGDAGHLIVGDFAPIVATMRQLLDNIAIHQWEAQQR